MSTFNLTCKVILLLGLCLNSTISVTLFQKIKYVEYVPYALPAVVGQHDYHSITIEWDGNDTTNDFTEDIHYMHPETWKYAEVRNNANVVEQYFNNDNLAHEYYKNFLPLYTGLLPDYNYVAWDITILCNSDTRVSITMKVKYFSCYNLALSFYNAVTSTDKVLVNTVNFDKSTTHSVYNYDTKNFLKGDGDTPITCPLTQSK